MAEIKVDVYDGNLNWHEYALNAKINDAGEVVLTHQHTGNPFITFKKADIDNLK